MPFISNKMIISLLLAGEFLVAGHAANAIIMPAVAASVAIQQRRRREQAARIAARQKYLAQLEALRIEKERAIAAMERKKKERKQFLESLSPEKREQFLLNEYRSKVKSKIHKAFIYRNQEFSEDVTVEVRHFKDELNQIKHSVLKMTEALILEKISAPDHEKHLQNYKLSLDETRLDDAVEKSFDETLSRFEHIIQNEISMIAQLSLKSHDSELTDYLESFKDKKISALQNDDIAMQYKEFCESIKEEISSYLQDIRADALQIEEEKKNNHISIKKGYYRIDDYELRKGGGLFGFLTKEKLRLKKNR